MTSKLRNKSEILMGAAKLLANNSTYYPAVAHSAYYSCYQIFLHIWLYNMGKTEEDLSQNINKSRMGSHEYLINAIIEYLKSLDTIKNTNGRYNDIREIQKIFQLKRLRVKADYKDEDFSCKDSEKSLSLATDIENKIKKYL